MRTLHSASVCLALLSTLVYGCGSTPDMDAPEFDVSQRDQPLYIDRSTVWSSPHIAVCWEDPGNAMEKGWVRDAIENTWMMETNVSFEGWAPCNAWTDSGIRIRTADEWPHVEDLGDDLNDETDGMVLNFWFNVRDDDGNIAFGNCLGSESAREACIRSIAVHEFGHALSFAHEQNRSDTPGWCDKAQGSDGDLRFGPWDQDSVMNYCNSRWNNYGQLSTWDIAGAQHVYGAPHSVSAARWDNNTVNAFVRGTDTAVHHRSWNGSSGGWWGDGGAITGTPAVASWGDGRVDVFVRGGDGALWHNGYEGGWWGWEWLGGQIVGSPTAIHGGLNRLHVFARGTDGQAYYMGWDGWNWTGWQGLGGAKVTGDIAAVSTNSGPQAFWRGEDGALWQVTSNGSGFNTPVSLGGVIKSSPSATAWGLGLVDVFARGTDRALWYRRSSGSGWTNWQSLGGTFTGNPTSVATDMNRLHVLVRGTDGALHERTWGAAGWGGWNRRGGAMVGSPTAVSSAAGKLDVFFRTSGSNGLSVIRYANNTWGTPRFLDGVFY